MPKFSQRSLAALKSCITPIQLALEWAIRRYDHTVIQGARSMEEHRANLAAGKSKAKVSLHVPPGPGSGKKEPRLARAVDATPFPVEWPELGDLFDQLDEKGKDTLFLILRQYHFAGYIQAAGDFFGCPLRWGGDWDGDREFGDQTFFDLVHFEARNFDQEEVHGTVSREDVPVAVGRSSGGGGDGNGDGVRLAGDGDAGTEEPGEG